MKVQGEVKIVEHVYMSTTVEKYYEWNACFAFDFSFYFFSFTLSFSCYKLAAFLLDM
jgi:hypothetical protein